ncbi:hypothetical protein [Methylorubrum sp. SL192]|uniref:hypothetical protein n=1 Tax=Methylorubrum sp. SL192 TaxID=2995167 RepID=UPI002276B2C4|nr:hypothetical protein [Methylorubrum sp. SL192]MCY1640544.1 hypothetical protein [Methylorubrum sp. SL192]
MVETIILYIIGTIGLIITLIQVLALAAIYIAHPFSTIIIFIGPFAIPIIYVIYLCIEEGFKTAIRFLITASAILATNYGAGFLMQSMNAARKTRRGVDLTMLFYSMTGLMIAITIVAISAIRLRRKERAHERNLIIAAARKKMSAHSK